MRNGEIPMEEGAGAGAGVSLALLVCMAWGVWCRAKGYRGQIAGCKLHRAVHVSVAVALLVYMTKMGTE